MVTHTTHGTIDVILRILGQSAPEADLAALDPDVSFREQLDIDSFDFLRFVVGVSDAVGVEIPEVGYSGLSTINDAVTSVSATHTSSEQAQ